MAPASMFHRPPKPVATGDDSEPRNYYSESVLAKLRLDAADVAGAGSLQDVPPKYADFRYEVDEAAFRRRAAASLEAGGLARSVPDGWPARLEGPLVWSKHDVDDESKYVYPLSDDDMTEIRGALEHFKGLGIDGGDVSKDTFPLPGLSGRLAQICDDVYDGRGFAVLRGLDPDAYGPEEMAVIYLGISSHVAERRGRQDQYGSMLKHVRQRKDEKGQQYSEDKPFHTDTVTDCLCLFTNHLAAEGGSSVLASAWTVYNEIAATRPDLIHVLAQPNWPFDTYGRFPPFYMRAVMYHHAGKVITSFSRRLLTGQLPHDPRTPGIPGLSEAQAEALDAVHFAALRHEIKPAMARGDLRFVNNMGILHRREAFVDSAAASRHLVRMWLNNPARCWELPDPLRLAWARVFDEGDDKARFWWIVRAPEQGEDAVSESNPSVAESCD